MQDCLQIFWCSTAVNVHNRSPTTPLKDKTLVYKYLLGKKPDISNLGVFGCKCCVQYSIPQCRRQKLDQKSGEAIFVGYPQVPKGYKLCDVKKKNFIVSGDVTFFETKFVHVKQPK